MAARQDRSRRVGNLKGLIRPGLAPVGGRLGLEISGWLQAGGTGCPSAGAVSGNPLLQLAKAALEDLASQLGEPAAHINKPAAHVGDLTAHVVEPTVDPEDEEILEAQKLLARAEGIWAGPTGVATLAVLRRLLAAKQLDPVQTICVIVSETGLKAEAEVPTRQGTAFDYASLRALVLSRLAE